ncbi:DUF6221 family protein [Streptomyces sp. SID5910]|uniref:DUF6221 family protein n=1 Tax=Streptomyces sp. SID5910 TaxID=2690312 RepID=UPI00136C6033|nr:DUF6221 family protein [Streptomyces sp. SID5910]MYR45061.1 hypothetical protein [Streptomyces sp. SID5910]
MDDLVQWLRAQLDEDERTARRAGDSFRQIGETGVIVATEGDRAEECASATWAGVAEHIVAHDPARVLREIDAKRRTLVRCEEAMLSTTPMLVHFAKQTVWEMAQPYADRPGYRESWRP